MIVVNTELVPGHEVVEVKGLVQGNSVRAKHAGRDIAASFKNLVGGELKGYTELLTESRRQAARADDGTGPATGGQRDPERAVHDECHHGGCRRDVRLRYGRCIEAH